MKDKILVFVLLLLLFAGCSQESPSASSGSTSTKRIHFSIAPMQTVNGNSVDGGSKSIVTKGVLTDESALKSMYVVVFSGGKWIATYLQALADDVIFPKEIRNQTCNIYFLANLKEAPSFTTSTSENFFKTSCSAGLTTLTQDEVATCGIPMQGSLINYVIPSDGIMTSASVILTRLLARVDIVYTNTVLTNFFSVTGLQLCNVPTITPYYSPATISATYYNNMTVSNLPRVSNLVSGTTYTYYVPANRRGAGFNSQYTNPFLKIGIGVTNPTYVQIFSNLYTYTLYLGSDDYINYDLNANTRYIVNANIKGIFSSNDSRVALPESNCYIVAPGDQVCIPISRANKSALGIQIADVTNPGCTASVFWEAGPSITADASLPTGAIVSVSNSACAGGYFIVTANAAAVGGNAVVCIKNTAGKILWSWHIWVTSADFSATANTNTTPVNGSTASNVWMDRNLGALEVAGTGGATFKTTAGMMYQWGRKDPFLPSITASPLRSMYIAGTDNISTSYSAYATTDIELLPTTPFPGDAYLKRTKSALAAAGTINYRNQLATSIASPMLFIQGWGGSTATIAAGDVNVVGGGANSWGGSSQGDVKSIYDPCPVGWRVPSGLKPGTSWASPWASFGKPIAGTTAGTTASPIFNSILTNGNYGDWGTYGKYPVQGIRKNVGELYDVGSYGYSWSGSVSSSDGSNMLFGNGVMSQNSSNNRACGLSVRCVKE